MHPEGKNDNLLITVICRIHLRIKNVLKEADPEKEKTTPWGRTKLQTNIKWVICGQTNWRSNILADNFPWGTQTLSDPQTGFQPGRGTESALIVIQYNLNNTVDSNRMVADILVDLSVIVWINRSYLRLNEVGIQYNALP